MSKMFCPKCGKKLDLQKKKRGRSWDYEWYPCADCNLLWELKKMCSDCPITVTETASLRLEP